MHSTGVTNEPVTFLSQWRLIYIDTGKFVKIEPISKWFLLLTQFRKKLKHLLLKNEVSSEC